MFGPLNGVRTTLVAGAVICAIVALIVGYPVVAVVLRSGSQLTAALWWWMYRHRNERPNHDGPSFQKFGVESCLDVCAVFDVCFRLPSSGSLAWRLASGASSSPRAFFSWPPSSSADFT